MQLELLGLLESFQQRLVSYAKHPLDLRPAAYEVKR